MKRYDLEKVFGNQLLVSSNECCTLSLIEVSDDLTNPITTELMLGTSNKKVLSDAS